MPPISVPKPSVRSPAASAFWSTLRPVISPSARNMPVDSIITTIITSVMVRIRIGSKVGVAISNGSTMSKSGALTTLSKFILPVIVATTPPMTMPINTAMFETKPLAKRAISRIDTSTSAAIPTPASSAYFGLGTLGASVTPFGSAGSAEPGAEAAAVTSASHLA